MKRFLIFTALLLSHLANDATPFSDSLMSELNSAVKNATVYDKEKLQEILLLKSLLSKTVHSDLTHLYQINLQLYDAYKYYNYDSAFTYVRKLQNLAEKQDDPSLLADAKTKLVFILLSGGMFKETFDTLNSISIKSVATPVMSEYYSLKARCYYDLADFNDDRFYSPLYNSLANSYIDSAIALFPTGSFDHIFQSSLRDFKRGHLDSSMAKLQTLIYSKKLSYHETALATSMIGGILMKQGQNDLAKDYLIRASIADIKSSTKETLALLYLAGIVFKEGKIRNAAQFIEKANADAAFYNARLRKVQIGAVLPLIEGEMINTIEVQKQRLVTYLVLLGVLTLALAVLALIIRKQVKKLKAARASLLEANLKQQQINQELVSANQMKEQYNAQLSETNQRLVEANDIKEKYNDRLQEINRQLSEANKIKEEYIGYYFSMDTEFIAKIEKLIHTIDKKLPERKWDEIKFLVNSVDLKKEKDDLLKNFDKVFLKLFPNFIAQFNTLFNEEDKIVLKDDQLLTADLRIFALIRLGITDNEKIAEILDYSVNTIYSKKTKIRSKTIIPKEELERKIMEITTLNL
ncbi:MAG: DUF6377 domain-containing protein [Bacteroidota bacterium]